MNKTIHKSLIAPVLLVSITGLGAASAEAGNPAFRENLWFSAEFFRPQIAGKRRSTFWAWDSRPASAFNGTLVLGYRLPDSPWSLAFRYNRETSKTDRHLDFSTTGRAYRAYDASKESHDVLDFEIGRDIGLGHALPDKAKIRAKMGIRFARFSATSRFTGHYTSYGVWLTPYDFDRRSRFKGIGPSIGLETRIRLGGSLSVDFEGSAAALYGRQSYKTYFWSSTSTRKKTIAMNLTGALGISYKPPGSNFRISAGYKADAWFNAMRAEKSPGQEGRFDRIYHGPFLRMKIGGN
jgi:hypothetical protein